MVQVSSQFESRNAETFAACFCFFIATYAASIPQSNGVPLLQDMAGDGILNAGLLVMRMSSYFARENASSSEKMDSESLSMLSG